MSSGGSGGSGWLSWLTTTWAGFFLLNMMPGWSLFTGMLAAWAVGVTAFTWWAVFGLKVACWFQGVICWLTTEVLGQVLPRLLPVMAVVPSTGNLGGSWWVQGFLVCDYVFPVHEFLVFAGITFVFVVTFRALRFGKQFIPTASN